MPSQSEDDVGYEKSLGDLLALIGCILLVAALVGIGAVLYGFAFQEMAVLKFGAAVTATTLIVVIVFIGLHLWFFR